MPSWAQFRKHRPTESTSGFGSRRHRLGRRSSFDRIRDRQPTPQRGEVFPRWIVELRGHLENGRAVVEVEDCCGGLDPEKVESMFAPFVRVDQTRTGLVWDSRSQAGDRSSWRTIRVQNLRRRDVSSSSRSRCQPRISNTGDCAPKMRHERALWRGESGDEGSSVRKTLIRDSGYAVKLNGTCRAPDGESRRAH